jgi:ribonuclease HI
MNSKVFYGVANGRTKGIFTTWTECEKSIKDFPSAKFKKFTSLDEAEKFVGSKLSTNLTNKYSNINFDSGSDSESNSEPKPKTKLTKLTKQVKSYTSTTFTQSTPYISSRAEEDLIRANINFDSSDSDSCSDSDTNTDLEPISKTKSNKLYELGDFKPDIIIYTDGSCISNGKSDAKAGLGVYFGLNDPRNISEQVQGKQSNNTAELGALIRAYKVVKTEIDVGKKVAFFTDSQYSLWCLTTYGDKCSQTKWTKVIPNKELVKEAYELFGSNKNPNIKLVHVFSHTGEQDIHSLGNEQADRLANLAIGIDVDAKISNPNPAKDFVKVDSLSRPVFVHELPTKKIYLKVAFEKKELAKKLSCRWDPDKKSWYCFESNTKALEQFGRSI